MTLDQAEAATRIRARLIRALEDGDYARLPNPGYVRGYISSYARLLELDSVTLLNLYKSETGSGRFHEISLPQAEVAVPHRAQQHAIPARAAVIVVLVVALLSLSIWAVARIWHGPETALPEPSPLIESSSTGEVDTATAVAKPTTQQAVKRQPFTLVVAVAASGASWLKVTVDGKKAYEGTLAGGQSETFEVSTRAVVLIGKPSVVTVKRDGTSVKIPNGGSTPSVTLDAAPTE
jgi:cytoskeletal protein RodZ